MSFCLFVHLNGLKNLNGPHWDDPQPPWHAPMDFLHTACSDPEPHPKTYPGMLWSIFGPQNARTPGTPPKSMTIAY